MNTLKGSVWNEQVDIGLLNLIKKVVKYTDENGDKVTPSVLVRNPEGEFQIKTFPSVSIFNYNQVFAKNRHNEQTLPPRKYSEDGKSIILEKPALPYDLFYQVDFWSEYQTDINDMTRTWLANVEPRTTLEVVDTEGNTRHCVMYLVDMANVDEKEGNVNIFRRAYSYRIWVELDEREPTTQRVVAEREIRRVNSEDSEPIE